MPDPYVQKMRDLLKERQRELDEKEHTLASSSSELIRIVAGVRDPSDPKRAMSMDAFDSVCADVRRDYMRVRELRDEIATITPEIR